MRVIASRERQRRIEPPSLALKERVHLFVQNLMRPLALPFAGGVCSAVILLSVWLVPVYPLRGNTGFDVPMGLPLATEATLKDTAPIANGGPDVVVDVIVDDQGRMVDYTVVSGQNVLQDEVLRRSIQNTLLFTEFVPATAYGKPIPGKMRLSLRSSRIDVKG